MKLTNELFTPPMGLPRPIASEKQADYHAKIKALGPFSRHEYDMDICVLYRQMDDLKLRYRKFNDAPFERYVEQIKDNVTLYLKSQKLEEEFYLNNFYCIVKPDSDFYFSYLGLFLALSDPLKITPILEHHLKDFIINDKEKQGTEHFLGNLEYLVCNFLRTNRFPEDYYARHDKIINWIYSKQNILSYQEQIDKKLEAVLAAINKACSTKVPAEAIKTVSTKKQPTKANGLKVEKGRLEILYQDLKEFFNEKSHPELKRILEGQSDLDSKVLFMGQANQLCDVFRIYYKEQFITGTKRDIAKWICDHFLYYIDSSESPRFFDRRAVENVLYGQDLPPKGPKRIKLSELSVEQHTFYPKK